jgi:hypothetical protein
MQKDGISQWHAVLSPVAIVQLVTTRQSVSTAASTGSAIQLYLKAQRLTDSMSDCSGPGHCSGFALSWKTPKLARRDGGKPFNSGDMENSICIDDVKAQGIGTSLILQDYGVFNHC